MAILGILALLLLIVGVVRLFDWHAEREANRRMSAFRAGQLLADARRAGGAQ